MKPQKLIYAGVFIVIASVVAPSLLGLWTFYNAFQALRTNQTAGIGAVGGVFEIAMIGGLFIIAGILTGTGLILYGSYKNKQQSKSSE